MAWPLVPSAEGSLKVVEPATALAAKVTVPDVDPAKANPVADTDRPAVKLAIDTLTVAPLWTIGNTSVPATGVVAAVRLEIFTLAIIYSYATVYSMVLAMSMYRPLLNHKPAGKLTC